MQYYTTNIWNVSGATAAGLATGEYGANDIGGSRSPDLIAMLRVDQVWGLFQASVAAHDNHAGYYGADETTGKPGDKWGWAGQLAFSIKNIPTGAGDAINMSAVYTNSVSRYNFQDLMGTTFAMYGGTGLAGAYRSVGLAGVSDAVFVTGSGQQLTTTYGFQGAYTHNWDPRWNTGIYGAWAAVRYNTTAKGYVCGRVHRKSCAIKWSCRLQSRFQLCNCRCDHALDSHQESDFLGRPRLHNARPKVRGWKYCDVAAAVEHRQAVYELKNQNPLTLLVRAQRNW